MGEASANEANMANRAEVILGNLGLTWENLQGKKVLDAGSGESALAQAGLLRGLDSQIVSLDVERHDSWADMPYGVKKNMVQADMEQLPFAAGSFDYMLMHGSASPLTAADAVRVLRSGGELRIYPIGGQLLEFWYVSYFLDQVKHYDQNTIQEMMGTFAQTIEESDGWIPNEFISLRKQALDTLTAEQKQDVIGMLVDRYSETMGIPFQHEINDPQAREPNGVVVYKKM